jgi:hypothetical protein
MSGSSRKGWGFTGSCCGPVRGRESLEGPQPEQSHDSCTTWVEPISKSPEEDNKTGELNKAKEVLRMVFPSGRGYDAAIAAKQRSAQRAIAA